MATHDYIISNASGAAVRADLNNALAAIATNNSSATEPTTTYAYQWWADTGSSPTVMKLRNAANSAWITLFQLDGEWTNIAFENGSAAAPSIYFKDSGTDTGFYSPGANQVGISTGGTSALVVDSSQRVGLGTSSPGYLLHAVGDLGVAISPTTNNTNANLELIARNGSSAAAIARLAAISEDVSTGASSFAVSTRVGGTGVVTERLRIDSSGRVGIGTATVGAKLEIATGDGEYTRVNRTGTTGQTGYLISSAGTNVAMLAANDTTGEVRFGGVATNFFPTFWSNNTERARIDTSGRLLVGTSSTSGVAKLQVQGYVGDDSGLGLLALRVGSSSPASGSGLGRIDFNDSTDSRGASIAVDRDGGTWSASSKPSRMVFSTTADGASSPTERMRLDSAGSMVLASGTAFVAPYIYNTTTASAANVHVTSGGFLLRSTSSLKYKENVHDATHGLAELLQLRPVTYTGKSEADGSTVFGGLIAEEVEAVGLSEFVQYAEDGSPDALAYGNMVSLCIKAIQEQQAVIEELKSKIAALEAS